MDVNYWILNHVFSPPRGTFFLAEKNFQGKPLGPRLSRVPEWNAKFNTQQHRLVHCSLFYTVKFSTPQLTQQRWVRPITCFILSTRFPLLLCFCLCTVEPEVSLMSHWSLSVPWISPLRPVKIKQKPNWRKKRRKGGKAIFLLPSPPPSLPVP